MSKAAGARKEAQGKGASCKTEDAGKERVGEEERRRGGGALSDTGCRVGGWRRSAIFGTGCQCGRRDGGGSKRQGGAEVKIGGSRAAGNERRREGGGEREQEEGRDDEQSWPGPVWIASNEHALAGAADGARVRGEGGGAFGAGDSRYSCCPLDPS
eukprot:741917-Hanusia_phi.AAC.1